MILLQCAHGAAYERLIACSRDWHARILTGWDIRIYREPRGARHPMWDKCRRMLETLQDAPDGEIVLWLDCDALILENPATALKNALESHDFAAVENVWNCYNTGAMGWTASHTTRKVAELIEQQGPSIRTAQEQTTIDFYARRQLKCRTLPRNWNDYQYAKPKKDPSQPVYIRAWHGMGPLEALREMEAELETLSHTA